MRARYLGIAVLSAVVLAHPAQAQDAEAARRAAIVVKLGPKSVTVGELEDRMAQVPPFQLRSFGATPDRASVSRSPANYAGATSLWRERSQGRQLRTNARLRVRICVLRANGFGILNCPECELLHA